MTMSVNHLTFVITIPKSDTIFSSTNAETGYEIRTFDEEAFMRELGAYLDTEDGIVLADTHAHFTTQTLSGVEYARLFKMVAPFTITFEDGAYQVNLTGGTNTNFIDVLNPNNVSVIPANSAGKQVIVSGSGVTEQDKDDIAAKTVVAGNLDYLQHVIFINTELAPAVGNGSELTPFGFTSDAIALAEAKGFRKLMVLADITVDRLIKNFLIQGVGTPKVDCNNQNLDRSEFNHVELLGQYTGRIVAQECNVTGNATTINGFFENCAFGSSFEVPDAGTAFIKNCAALVAGFVKPVYSVGGATGTANLILMGYMGGATITDCNQATDEVKIVSTGIVEIDASCTDGVIVVLGVIKPIDNSNGATVLWYNLNPEEMSDVWDAHYNKRDRDTVSNIIDLYNRDGLTIKKQFQSDAGYNLVDPI